MWCNSSSAGTQDNVLKWISEYDSLADDKRLILCIPVFENHKDESIDILSKVIIKDVEDNNKSSGMYDVLIKTFGHIHRIQTIAYLSMTKDSESYLKGKSNIKNLDLYESSGDVFKLYSKESVDLFHHSAVLLNDSSEWIAKYELFTKCSNNYLSLTEGNEKIKEIKKDIDTKEYRKILLKIQSDIFAKKLQLKINKSKQ
jgi:hypothetical protein